MSVLFASSNYDGFQLSNLGTLGETNSGAQRDTNYGPAAITLSSLNGADCSAVLTAATTNTTWLHFSYYVSLITVTANTIISFYDVNDVEVYRILGSNGTNRVFQFQRLISGSYETILTSSAFTDNVVTITDIKIFTDSSAGNIEIYQGNVLAASFTGNTTTDGGVAGIKKIKFVRTLTVNQTYTFSEIIIADEPTVGWRLEQENATGVGTNSGFTGSFSDIDEPILNTADKITSDTNGSTFTAVYADPTQIGSRIVKAVVIASTVNNTTDSAVGIAKHLIRISTTNYASGAITVPKTNAQTGIFSIFAINPATSAAWSNADINAAQFGITAET